MLSWIPRDTGRTIRWIEDCFQKMASDRLEKYVWSPTDKRVAAYLTPVWGDIPAKRWWPSAAGASYGWRRGVRNN